MQEKSIKVIFDTNVWVSFLTGKKLSVLSEYISSSVITIVITHQLLHEIKDVTSRPAIKKYFKDFI